LIPVPIVWSESSKSIEWCYSMIWSHIKSRFSSVSSWRVTVDLMIACTRQRCRAEGRAGEIIIDFSARTPKGGVLKVADIRAMNDQRSQSVCLLLKKVVELTFEMFWHWRARVRWTSFEHLQN
jgi:hypothetical protein